MEYIEKYDIKIDNVFVYAAEGATEYQNHIATADNDWIKIMDSLVKYGNVADWIIKLKKTANKWSKRNYLSVKQKDIIELYLLHSELITDFLHAQDKASTLCDELMYSEGESDEDKDVEYRTTSTIFPFSIAVYNTYVSLGYNHILILQKQKKRKWRNINVRNYRIYFSSYYSVNDIKVSNAKQIVSFETFISESTNNVTGELLEYHGYDLKEYDLNELKPDFFEKLLDPGNDIFFSVHHQMTTELSRKDWQQIKNAASVNKLRGFINRQKWFIETTNQIILHNLATK